MKAKIANLIKLFPKIAGKDDCEHHNSYPGKRTITTMLLWLGLLPLLASARQADNSCDSTQAFLYISILLIIIIAGLLYYITKQKKHIADIDSAYQARLAEENDKKKLLMDMPLSISIYDNTGKLTFSNTAFRAMMGVEENYEMQGFDLPTTPLVKNDILSRILNGETGSFQIGINFNDPKSRGNIASRISGTKYLSNRFFSINDKYGKIKSIILLSLDVTERHLKNLELESNKQKNELAIRSSNITQWEYDVKSKEMKFFEGDTMAVFHSDNFSSIIHEEDLAILKKYIQLMDDGIHEDFNFDLRMKSYDRNEWQHIRLTGAPMDYDSKGKPVKYAGLRNNVTSWFNLTKELKEQNELTNVILNNIDSGFVYTDVTGKVLWENVSSRFPLSVTGALLFEKGKYCFDTHSRYKIPCTECLIFKTLRTLRSARSEKILISGYAIEVVSNPVMAPNDEPMGVVLRVTDISDKKNMDLELQKTKDQAQETNQLLAQILDRLPIALFIKEVDNNFNYIVANREFCHQISVEEKDIIGHNDFELIERDRAQEFAEQDIEATSTNQTIEVISSYTDKKEGALHYIKTIKAPVMVMNKRKLLIGFSVDITAQRQINEDLIKAKEKAEESDKLKSAFLANMSHEIRTPLNAIAGFSQLLMETDDKEEIAQYNEIIASNNELLLHLIDDILDLSKIDAGIAILTHDETDIIGLMSDLTAIISFKLNNPDIKFIIDNPYEYCLCEVDKNRLSQVWLNFLTNAYKYTSKGYIKTGFRYIDKQLYIYVEDTGIGIPDDKKPLVFQRFEKLDNYAQGNGLGLSICKAIIDMAKGDIGFTSTVGKGSIFWAKIHTQGSSAIKAGNDGSLPDIFHKEKF